MAMSAPEVFVDEPRLEKFMIFHSGLGATRRGGLLWRCGACVGEPVLTRWHGCVCVCVCVCVCMIACQTVGMTRRGRKKWRRSSCTSTRH